MPIIIASHVSRILCITKDGSELLVLPKRIGQTILSAERKLNHLQYLALKETVSSLRITALVVEMPETAS